MNANKLNSACTSGVILLVCLRGQVSIQIELREDNGMVRHPMRHLNSGRRTSLRSSALSFIISMAMKHSPKIILVQGTLQEITEEFAFAATRS